MDDSLHILFSVATTFGLIILLAAYIDKNYKYAMWAALTFLASLIILLAINWKH